jgi:hypothetical protein
MLSEKLVTDLETFRNPQIGYTIPIHIHSPVSRSISQKCIIPHPRLSPRNTQF